MNEDIRSNEQNRLLNRALQDLSEQINWRGSYLSKDEWRWLCAADIFGMKAVPGIHGGVVLLGRSSRKLSKSEFTDLITLVLSIGDDPESYGVKSPRVKWSPVIRAARGISDADDEMADRHGASK